MLPVVGLAIWLVVILGSATGAFDLSNGAAVSGVRQNVQEKDILMLQDGDILYSKAQLDFRNAHPDYSYRWLRGVVPYVLDESLSIKELEVTTCVRFVPRRSSDPDYIRFVSRLGCYSYIGRIGGEQVLSLGIGCEQKGTAIHEIMHALGLFHEHNRPDRDKYVTIAWEHVQPDREHNFCINDGQTCSHSLLKLPVGNTLNVKYDYSSIMHYGPYYFSRDGSMTIVPRVNEKEMKLALSNMGQRMVLSELDKEKLRLYYNCSLAPMVTTPSTSAYIRTTAPTIRPTVPTTTTSRTSTKPSSPTSSATISATSSIVSTTVATIADKRLLQACADTYPRCSIWADANACHDYPGEMLLNCRVACNNCDGGKCWNTQNPSYASTCSKISGPEHYYCENHVYRTLCPLSCGLCSVSSSSHALIDSKRLM